MTQPVWAGMIETDIFATISLGCSTQPSRVGMIETSAKKWQDGWRTDPAREGWDD